jgi:D-glycero-D-manno-heptose 1,7-bisphosphate phosphatase
MISWINSPSPSGQEFLLLDRDGIINVDSPAYVKNWREFHFYPDALEALMWLKERRIQVILISNQSALNRGIMRWEDFLEIHTQMVRSIQEKGGDILAAFYCPHLPDENCACRKPSPGMILAAQRQFHIPPERTHLIGDKMTDMRAAAQSGCCGILLDRFGAETKNDRSESSEIVCKRRSSNLIDVVQELFGSR